ncbi:hypothetical protein DDE82_006644 [Stemphylium lycopersici]|uniref:Uncharacterized protein n=1 Tax=Stemphylium lycopersici TaxID=183478 RepID=A0A364N0J2_STELY|nr:hypothetical protein TW65_04927 [Stemphylium lycopersici]RAR01302.1 hypothetical protein DDE82_006644 [Stemphylium lycopersici]RAR08737.1 hypothetical protein DDE83_005861 [Stemphylium lycopersici]
MSESTAPTPRTSIENLKSPSLFSSSTSIISFSSKHTSRAATKPQNLWQSFKRHAKEHHDALNAAYVTYYGQGGSGRGHENGRKQEIWEYRRSSRADWKIVHIVLSVVKSPKRSPTLRPTAPSKDGVSVPRRKRER